MPFLFSEMEWLHLLLNTVLIYNKAEVEMGCVTTKDTDIADPTQIILRNKKIDDLVYEPLFSNLFNMLRKKNDIEIIRKDATHPLFNEELVLDGLANTNDMKMLCNFKNVLIVGELEIASLVKRSANPKAIYLLSIERAQEFLTIFPIFRTGQPRLEPRHVPIVALYEQELACNLKNKANRRIIYLHSQKYKNQELYEKLSIDQIVKQTSESKSNVLGKLAQPGKERVLYLHASDTKQDELLSILIQYLQKHYNINESNSRSYFQQILPQTKHHQLQVLPKSEYIISVNQSKLSSNQKSLTEILEHTLYELYKEMGKDEAAGMKLERSYNLIVNLITNIYVNKESENFRKVKKTNKQINQSLGKYQFGIKLLEDVGFVDEGGFYVNNMDVKYLKIYRTDLDLAYKKYNEGKKNI